MNIKNYTSTIEATRSMARIEELLVEIGASNINKRYEEKICSGITFLLYDQKLGKTIAFQIKAQVEECFKIFWAERTQKTEAQKKGVMLQANRTAWKILSDWTEIQCSMVLLDQATPLQMFLPFVYDMQKDETLYDKVMSGKLDLLLPSSK